ncbi:MAG: hypothetical protein GC168_09225 [Candidatus Hydrogenedens sp.]|nr:hypothetical protein [Candidatus Hydrogenedens sp.]
MITKSWFLVGLAALAFLFSQHASAITLPSEFAGSDGAFEPTSNITIDLSQAVTGQWDLTSGSGNGVYDPAQWAVIFRYTSVNIPQGVTVTFKNHPSVAPVMWLVQGDVVINGTVNLNGANGHGNTATPTPSEPGPGGFRGGRGTRGSVPASAGFGPGGAPADDNVGRDGSYATVGSRGSSSTYGNPGVFPLIGGSGGSGGFNDDRVFGAGAGGGALLISTPSQIAVNGKISADGGRSNDYWTGHGSGGAIRLVCDNVGGLGILSALGGQNSDNSGGSGRIRIEANSNDLADLGSPPYTTAIAAETPRIFRTAGDGIPSIKAVTLGGEDVPEDPRPKQTLPADVQIAEEGTKTLSIEAANVPASSVVTVRVIPVSGEDSVYQATYDGEGGEAGVTMWSVDVDLAGGFSTVQVYAALTE